MWDLMFRIGGDTAPLRRKLDQLAPDFEAAGKKISERFKLGAAGGIAAAVTVAVLTLNKAVSEAVTESVTALRESARLGTTVTEFEQLSVFAERTGRSVDDLVASLKAGGPAAEALRKSLGDVSKAAGSNISEDAAKRLSLGAGVAGNMWNTFKSWAAEVAGVGVQAASIGVHGVAGMGEGLWAMLKGGSFTETFSDRLAQGITAADSDATRTILANGRAQMAANALKRSQEAGKSTDRKKSTGDRQSFLVKRPDTESDALTRVGIGTAAFDNSQQAFQSRSLEYLKQIAAATKAAAADPMEGVQS